MIRLLPLVLLAGCTPSEMAQSWEIDRMRILGVQASVLDENGALTAQAEPGPGDVVVMRSLTVHPDIEAPSVIWTGCFAEESDAFGCAPTEGDDGFLGVEPLMPITLAVPETILDELPEEDKLEGLSYLLTLIAVPDIEELDENLSPDGFSNDEEIATKYIPISLAETPNNNPYIEQVLVEKVPVGTGTTLTVTPGQSYFFEPVLAVGPEEYIYVNSQGEAETRTEEPYFSWYSTEGTLDRPFSSYESSAFSDTPGVTWTAPDEPERSEARLWIVVRDGRGGMGWVEQTLLFE